MRPESASNATDSLDGPDRPDIVVAKAVRKSGVGTREPEATSARQLSSDEAVHSASLDGRGNAQSVRTIGPGVPKTSDTVWMSVYEQK